MGKIDDERNQRTAAARDRRIEALTNAMIIASSGSRNGLLENAPHALAAVLDEITCQVDAYAALLAENREKGWQSQQAVYAKAAPIFAEWADEFRAAAGAVPADVVAPTPLRDIEPGDVIQDAAPSAVATSAEVEDYLRGKRDELPPFFDSGPSIGGYVTPQRAEEVRTAVAEAKAEAQDAVREVLDSAPHEAVAEAGRQYLYDQFQQDSPEVPVSQPAPAQQFVVPTMIEPPAVVRRDRLTYPQFLQIAMSRPEPEHRSHSQVSGFAECAGREVLSRACGGRPMWSNVGGGAFHKFVERWERALPSGVPDPEAVESWWNSSFAEAIAEQEAKTPQFSRSTWYVANRGRENEDWWRVEGLEMCRTYVKATQDDVNGMAPEMMLPVAPWRDGSPMIEWEFDVKIGGQKFVGFIDQIRHDHKAQRLIVVDLKAGSRLPNGPQQLIEYAHCLALMLGLDDAYRIDGVFYSARNGTTRLYENLRRLETLDGFGWRVATMDRADKAGIWQFNASSSFCSSCGVNDLCPANGR